MFFFGATTQTNPLHTLLSPRSPQDSLAALLLGQVGALLDAKLAPVLLQLGRMEGAVARLEKLHLAAVDANGVGGKSENVAAETPSEKPAVQA